MELKTILEMPNDFVEYDGDEIMSNFDMKINEETALAIKNKKLFSRYAGWNFNGKVFWLNNQWNCEVWVYGSPQQIISADTLKELMTDVSDEYGYD